MGLSIYYSGKLKEAVLLKKLIEEIKDISEAFKWEYHIFEKAYPENKFSDKQDFENIYGIKFTPPECETISLTFLSNGLMVCPSRVLFFARSKDEKERSWIYNISVKTQYAGKETHKFIIHLFQYLNEKYFDDFQMMDEAHYWETNDEEILENQFKVYQSLVDNFGLAIETIPMNEGEDITTYFERLMRKVRGLKKD